MIIKKISIHTIGNIKKNTELKHYMYAGQWFLFAIVALFFAFKLLGRSKNEKKSN